MGMLFCSGCQKEKEFFLPEAENDTIFTVIGE
jgi:cell division protein FtsW (lipid II flippase)